MSAIGNTTDEILALRDDVRFLAQAILSLADALNADPGLVSIDYREVVVPDIRKVALDILTRAERRPTR